MTFLEELWTFVDSRQGDNFGSRDEDYQRRDSAEELGTLSDRFLSRRETVLDQLIN